MRAIRYILCLLFGHTGNGRESGYHVCSRCGLHEYHSDRAYQRACPGIIAGPWHVIVDLVVGAWTYLRCKHEWRWYRNLYGDQITYSGGMRSTWRCTKCGHFKDRPELHEEHNDCPF